MKLIPAKPGWLPRPGAPRKRSSPLSFLHRRKADPLRARDPLYDPELKDQSVDTLLVSGVKDCVRTAGQTTPYLNALATSGGLTLMSMSMGRLARAEKPEEMLEALSDAQWGAQAALPMVGPTFNLAPQTIGVTATYLGTVGAAIQGAVGVQKLLQGVEQDDADKTLVGISRIGAGTCWALASMSVAPAYTGAGFIALTVGEKLYTNREKLLGVVRAHRGSASGSVRTTADGRRLETQPRGSGVLASG